MMQWVPWGQTLDAFRAHVRTFRDVFPNVLIAFGPGGYGLFMLGSEAPLSLDPANVQAVLARPGDHRRHLVGLRLPEPRCRRLGRADRLARLDLRAIRSPGSPVTDRSSPTTARCPEYFLLRQLLGPKSPTVTPGLLRQLTPDP